MTDRKAYRDKYYAENRERLLAQKREYRAKNKEAIAAREKAWKSANKDKVKAWQKRWYETHQDWLSDYISRYRPANKEKIAKRIHDYYVKNQETIYAQKIVYKRNNKKKVSKWSRQAKLKKYGLSQDGFENLLASQGGVCAICGTSEWGRVNPLIDHDHETGDVRGLLCHNCNVSLGLMGDDPQRLIAAAQYLEQRNRAYQGR